MLGDLLESLGFSGTVGSPWISLKGTWPPSSLLCFEGGAQKAGRATGVMLGLQADWHQGVNERWVCLVMEQMFTTPGFPPILAPPRVVEVGP